LNAPLIVLDTGVVVRALTGRPDSASSEVVRAVQTGAVRLAVSDAFLIETTRVLRKPRVESRIGSACRL
jgi:predicted nucleic acid-binding protein